MLASYVDIAKTGDALEDAKGKRDEFVRAIPRHREERRLDYREPGKVRLPPGEGVAFWRRSDLAAELWTVRESVHDMVLNSPEGMVLVPGELSIIHEYRLVKESDVSVKVMLAAKELGGASSPNTVTDHNRMGIFFLKNESDDPMRCDDSSVTVDTRKRVVLGESHLP